MKFVVPVLTVVAAILGFWLLAVIPMNMHLVADQAQRDGLVVQPDEPAARQDLSGLGLALRNTDLVPLTYSFTRPRLPAPQQVAGEMYETIFTRSVTSKRSLVYHGWDCKPDDTDSGACADGDRCVGIHGDTGPVS